jgi:hypothetical protein
MKLTTLFAAVLLAVPAFAGIAGRWDVTSVTNEGEKMKSLFTVTEAEGKTNATLVMGEQTIPLENVTITAEQASFRLMWGNTGVNVKVKLDGEKLAGTWTADSGETGPVTAVRAAGPVSANAFFNGKWKLTVTIPDRDPIKADMEVKEEAGVLSANLITPDGMTVPGKAAIADGKLAVTVDTGSATYTLKFERDGEGLKGVATGPNGDLPMTATR